MKRAVDVAISILVLAASLPLVVLLGPLLLRQGRPLFYRGVRVGHRGRLFRITKLRTMRAGPDADPHGHVAGNDPRITDVGRVLRRLKVDEWPQWWHVLIGDMSVVGPRPMTPEEVAEWPTPTAAAILAVRPGLVDWATLAFAEEGESLARAADPRQHYSDVIRPRKLALAHWYATSPSWHHDPVILWHAARLVLARSLGHHYVPLVPSIPSTPPSHA